MKRNKIIDYMKGIAITLMVLGHSYFPLTHFVYLFHMAIFFMAAGFCYDKSSCNNIGEFIRYVKKRVKKLYIPYLIINITYLCLYNFFIKINFYTNNILLLQTSTGDIYGIREYIGFGEFIRKLISTLCFCTPQLLCGPTWFLRVLFAVSIGYAFVDFMINKGGLCKYRLIIQGVTAISCLWIGYFMQIHNIVLTAKIPVMFSVYILFWMGQVLNKYDYNLKKCFYTSAGAVISLLILVVLDNFGTIEIGDNIYPNPIYLVTVSVAGWIILYFIGNILDKLTKEKQSFFSDMLQYVGMHSVWILCLHLTAFKLINYIGVICNNMNYCFIAADPCLMTGGMWWIAYGIAGVVIPLTLYHIQSRIIRMEQR